MLKVFYTAHIEEADPTHNHQKTSEQSGCSNPSEFITEADCDDEKDHINTATHDENMTQSLVTHDEDMTQPLVTLTDDFCSSSPYDDKETEEFAADETATVGCQQQDQGNGEEDSSRYGGESFYMIYNASEQLLSLTSSQLGTVVLPIKSSLSQLLKPDEGEDKPTAPAAVGGVCDLEPKLTQPLSLLPTLKGKSPTTGEMMFVCNVDGCNCVFTSIGYLKCHQSTAHNHDRELHCTYPGCDRTFVWPAHLKYHQLTHTGERYYKCSVENCIKSFYTAQRLMVHMRTHTGEKPFRCPEKGCGKSFTTAGNLKNHVRTHSGERPYACEVENCGRKFAECNSLKKHKLVHSGLKPYMCEVCGKTYSQGASRNVHMRKSHPIVAIPTKPHDTTPRQGAVSSTQDSPSGMQPEENTGTIQYNDLRSTQSVVFTQPVTEETQTDNINNKLRLSQHVMDTQESTQDVKAEAMASRVNVVVLSQPLEMAVTTRTYDSSQPEAMAHVTYDSSQPEATAHVTYDSSQPGATAHVTYDSSQPGAMAHVTYDSSQPEATAHVTYDRSQPESSEHATYDREGLLQIVLTTDTASGMSS